MYISYRIIISTFVFKNFTITMLSDLMLNFNKFANACSKTTYGTYSFQHAIHYLTIELGIQNSTITTSLDWSPESRYIYIREKERDREEREINCCCFCLPRHTRLLNLGQWNQSVSLSPLSSSPIISHSSLQPRKPLSKKKRSRSLKLLNKSKEFEHKPLLSEECI